MSTLPDDPVLNALTPTVGNFLRGQEGARLPSVMLQTAIQHRLNEIGTDAAPPPADPWGKDREPFAVESLPEGAFRLRSRYELREGQPVTLEIVGSAMPKPR